MSNRKKINKKKKDEQKDIADERIRILFAAAEEAAHNKDLKQADEYIEQIRKIAMKSNLKIPKEYKTKLCRYCYRYLLPPVTSRTRINSKQHRIEVKCLNCGKIIFYPFTREIKEKRRKNERKNQDTAGR